MSVKEVIRLAKECKISELSPLFGPTLVTLLVSLIEEVSDVCIKQGIDLGAHIPAFSRENNELQRSLCKVYESLCLGETRQLQK